jgi:hypothetical protein
MKRYATVVLLAVLIGLPQIARAQRQTPPPVPPEIEVPPGHRPFLAGHAVGTQGSMPAWERARDGRDDRGWAASSVVRRTQARRQRR